MDAERWQRLSPLLDALLELEAEARRQSLASLRDDDPGLADELEALLQLEEDSDDFLSEPLVAPLPGLRSGALIGPYRLERMLGEGGMGQVWLARRDDGLYQRRVALKLLRPGLADPNLRLRFTRERQILERLEHPHIARLLDAGISADGQPYLALEYVDGEPITDWCRARALNLEVRLQLFQQICRALSHAHANLIVHRDLKPSNILVTPLDEVRLLDFGIAKLLDGDSAAPEHTRTGVRAFTLHYAAPEQLRGEPVTTMTDVYSLGMVLYELLADCRPYRLKRQSDAEWEEAILHSDPLRPSLALQRLAETDEMREHAQALRRRSRQLAGDLDNIVLKALSKRPEQRYASVEALALDVQRYRQGKPVRARAQSMGYRIRKYVHRHRWALSTGVLVTLVMAVALMIVAWQARTAVSQANRAQAMQDFVIGLIGQAGGASATGQLDLHSLLDNGLQRVDRELAQQPTARAELYGVIAELHAGLGDYKQALTLLQRQRAMIVRLPDSPAALQLSSIANLGQVQRLLGEPGDCVDSMQALAGLARRQAQAQPLPAAEFYSQLGRCHRDLGQHEPAEILFRQSLGIRRKHAGTDIDIVENLVDLANLQSDAGNSARALREYRAALRQLDARTDVRQPLEIDLRRGLCALERGEGHLAVAERECRSALALGRSLQGAQHRATIDARRQLAAIHVDQGRYREAEKEFENSRQWLIIRLGANHVDVARDDNSLGIIAWERGQSRNALAFLDHAIGILRRASRPNGLAGVLFNKAMVLHESRADAEALALLRESRTLRVAQLGATHPVVGDTDRLIGEVEDALGFADRARANLESGATLTRAGYGPAHPHAWRAALSLARYRAHVDKDPTAALAGIAAVARIAGSDAESDKLRWRARAYLAQAGCRSGAQAAAARTTLEALQAEVDTAQPEGGELAREIDGMLARCAAPLSRR